MAGVLTFNNVVRERHLQENLGLYSGVNLITPSYLYYTFNTKPLSVLMGKGGLYEYTHNEETEYSKNIGHLYFKHRPDFQPYINIDPINPQNFWGGEFNDYYDYVNAVYGQITPPIQFIEGLLSTQFLDEAIRVTSPAIVHNPEPTLSMAGAIKTNVNNFSGRDTRLGLLGNQMYAYALYHGANFNTMRKGTASFNDNVITPSVGVRFGNSDYTINSLSNIVSPLRADGRIVEDYNEGIGIIHSLSQITTNTELVKKDKETRQGEKEEYKKLKAKYDGELKKYKQALQDLKDGKITENQVPQKPVKPQKPSKKTTAEFIANDINFSNLFKTLQFNVQFNKDIFDFESYANTRYYNGHSRSAEDFSIEGQKGKIKGVTQHIIYNDDNIDKFKISDKYGLNNFEATSEETPDAQFYITEFDNYIPLNNAHGVSNNSLIHKTNEIFNKHKVNTFFGEHTILSDEINGLGFGNFVDSYYKNSTTDSSTTVKGRSRGRNLLKKNEDYEENGIPHPFCRAWTYHHQYDRMDKLIRPLSDEMTIEETQALNKKYRAWNTLFGQQVPGEKYLAENTVLNNNGLVNIAPSNEGKVDIKKCMFSIENLAWKDVLNLPTYLSKEQRGPNGGRIMWFPPYDLNFSENTNVNWEQSTFIGRGEKVYTYSNTDRIGNLSFTLLIDHPSTIHNIYTEEGNLRDGITDDDILRFFAGCAPLESPEEKRPIPTPIPTTDTEVELTSDKTSIYVYFPNNYSGHYNNVINSSAEDTTTPPDNDFVDYMVYGINAKTLAPSECEWCHGTGLCPGCNGEGTTPCSCGDGLCENCKGSGYATCDECEGNGKIECPTCKGLGQVLKEIDGEKKAVTCPTCFGSCEVLCKTCLGDGEIKCTECHGTGVCSKCSGDGMFVCDFCRQDESLKIKDGPNKGKYMCLHCEGKGIIPYETLEPRGYEMSSNGLSVTKIDSEITTEGAFLCCKTKPKTYTECLEEGNKYFYYRTDFDLKQNGLLDSNYKDSTSFSLNSLNGSGAYNFSTLIFALKYKDKDFMFEAFKEYMKKIINDDEKFNKFIDDGIKLYEILSNSSIISRITISGSGSLQDSKNSQMLAKRRGGTLQHLIEASFPDLKGKFIIGYHTAQGKGQSVNTKDIKENRYSRIDIEYYTSKTDTLMDDNNKIITEKQDLSKQTVITDYEFTRYENEAQYFQKLKTTDPTTFRKLTEKYKYFTPAFHSVSPEGFNARLTFLQQCTRQGHTLEPKFTTNNSDAPTAIAGNLAFGRMPVCVLRIGDFIYSRVIITSMNINYGDNQWDLNPEGAGVQPMMAKVNLGITILGGQSLEGPISKLQNAVTFNYYANAGVYDDRADRAKPIGDSNKWSTDYYYTWEPEYSGDSGE